MKDDRVYLEFSSSVSTTSTSSSTAISNG